MLSDKNVILKDGTSVIISKYRETDFIKLVEMYSSLSKEALRWLRPPYNEETIKKLSKETNLIFVAKYQNKIIGHCMLLVRQHTTGKGISALIICIHQNFQNKGLGTTLIKTIVDWAKTKDIHRIELGVVAEHEMAIYVYQKTGFKIEGIQKEAYYGPDRKYHDRVIMGLILR